MYIGIRAGRLRVARRPSGGQVALPSMLLAAAWAQVRVAQPVERLGGPGSACAGVH